VAGMLKHHHLAQAIAAVGFGQFRCQLVYTAAWYGSRVVLAERWEPSSKTCSGCGWAGGRGVDAGRAVVPPSPCAGCLWLGPGPCGTQLE
jgi:transposase